LFYADEQTDMTKLIVAFRDIEKSEWKALYWPQSWAFSVHLPSSQHISVLPIPIIPNLTSTSSSPKRSPSFTFFYLTFCKISFSLIRAAWSAHWLAPATF
jgi:hypothetical protein